MITVGFWGIKIEIPKNYLFMIERVDEMQNVFKFREKMGQSHYLCSIDNAN